MAESLCKHCGQPIHTDYGSGEPLHNATDKWKGDNGYYCTSEVGSPRAEYDSEENGLPVKLENLTFDRLEPNEYRLLMDWDNDWHQEIRFSGNDPDSVIQGLLDSAYLIAGDKKNKNLT